MSLNVHVFIATNKGLVAIQSLTDLQDNALQSVITINGSTDLATISPSYHRFVQKSTGLIQAEFGVASVRANISRNIDVGSSWQLPFYLAHFIQANAILHNTNMGQLQSDAVKLGHGSPKSGDIVLIATGQINTSSNVIEAVSHIPEKCITASAQIKLWMKKGILVEFFVPASGAQTSDWQQKTEHQKTHEFGHTKSLQYKLLPEVDCAIYPVIDTRQLREHVSQLLPSTEINEKQGKESRLISSLKTELEKNTQHTQNSTGLFANTENELTEPSVSLNQLSGGNKLPQNNLKSLSTAFTQPKSLVRKLFSSKLKTTLILLLFGMAVAATYSIMSVGSVYPETRFVTKTKSGLHCDANTVEQLINVAEQYVSRIPSVTFSSACSMTLITASKIPQVWLVADSKTLIELSSTAIGKELHWTVPLPRQQQVDREYVLIVTEHSLDLADLSAFKSYLSRLEQSQKPAVEILAMFFSQISVNPQYVSHKLIASEN
jgi:hypothetical protein